MSKDDHKIDADDRTVFEVLNERKYTVDYFQREYSWQQRHIEQLITDLTSSFLDAYTEGDPRPAVEHYNNYYLGPFVVSSKGGMKSIIDGQQRLTSLTLFLIYLNNLQKELGGKESIEPLVFSEKFGQKSFNIQVEERKACLEKLFLEGCYEPKADDDESTVNMLNRYADIGEAFPDNIKGDAFPYFLDWLKYNVILVEITAYSDDNAYTIFESMNDRGLNLTSTEMLKGYILSRFDEAKDREKANQFWRESIQTLHQRGKDEDQRFFQAWLRSQYADTIRQGKAGSSNEDFEKIGTRFHSWFRDNLSKMGVSANSSSDFRTLLHDELKFYLRYHLAILDAQTAEKAGWESVFYSRTVGYCGLPRFSSDDGSAEIFRFTPNGPGKDQCGCPLSRDVHGSPVDQLQEVRCQFHPIHHVFPGERNSRQGYPSFERNTALKTKGNARAMGRNERIQTAWDESRLHKVPALPHHRVHRTAIWRGNQFFHLLPKSWQEAV